MIIDKFNYDEILKNDKLSFKDIFYGTIILPNYLFYILKNKIKNIAANVVKKILELESMNKILFYVPDISTRDKEIISSHIQVPILIINQISKFNNVQLLTIN